MSKFDRALADLRGALAVLDEKRDGTKDEAFEDTDAMVLLADAARRLSASLATRQGRETSAELADIRRRHDRLERGSDAYRRDTANVYGRAEVVVLLAEIDRLRASALAPVAPESPVLAFDAWLTARIASGMRKLTQDEYSIAQAAFYAAHPWQGPTSSLMALAQVAGAPDLPGLSLSLQNDHLAVAELLDDGTREREMYHRLVLDIRHTLGDDGLHVQLLDLPKLIAQKLAAPSRVAPISGAQTECIVGDRGGAICLTHDNPLDWVECTGWRCDVSGQVVKRTESLDEELARRSREEAADRPTASPLPRATEPEAEKDADILAMWRSVNGPLSELNGPLIRFAALVRASSAPPVGSRSLDIALTWLHAQAMAPLPLTDERLAMLDRIYAQLRSALGLRPASGPSDERSEL